MLPERRYRRYDMVHMERRPKLWIRAVMILAAILILWYLGSLLLGFFDGSVQSQGAAVLTLERPGSDIQVALQGGEWQQAESNLKVYADDALKTRSEATGVLTFFDGTKIRLDRATQLQINDSNPTGAKASIELTVTQGRIWIATPPKESFSGAVMRTVHIPSATVNVPSGASAGLGTPAIVVLRSDGAGLTVQLQTENITSPTIVVGEGQMFALSTDAIARVENGGDPYDFRDPVSTTAIRDEFVSASYALLRPSNIVLAGTTASSAGIIEDLMLTEPDDQKLVRASTVTVRGKVGPAIASVFVNGSAVSLRPDGNFSTDVSMSGTSMIIKVEGKDDQGITLATVTRTVKGEIPKIDPVKISSPVGSGGTFQTANSEVEITGIAPAAAQGIMVNDYRLQLFKPGSRTFSYLASAAIGSLKPGTNVYTIVALDKDGSKGVPVSITIEQRVDAGPAPTAEGSASSAAEAPLKQNPPIKPGTLSVNAPGASPAETTEKEVLIEGTTDADTASISVNGYTLSLYQAGKNTWNYIASTEMGTMKRGRNVYRIVSRNANGEILDVLEYTMMFRP